MPDYLVFSLSLCFVGNTMNCWEWIFKSIQFSVPVAYINVCFLANQMIELWSDNIVLTDIYNMQIHIKL